jgi:predicted regulator of Ras-like GTPase activity (Roadblock/LC7/MglB family)
MPLLVGQIIYTSFPGVGFRSLVSQQVPSEIQQAFIQQVVYQHWDTYNPPKAAYRAAYLYQFSPDRNLFGWLYNEGADELGRANIPYCIGYYLGGLLSTVQLENILTCLDIGPVAIVDRGDPPSAIDNVTIPDLCNYQPVRLGVAISPAMRKQTHKELLQKKLLNLFVCVDEMERTASRDLKAASVRLREVSLDNLVSGGELGRSFESDAPLPVKALSPSDADGNWTADRSVSAFKIERILQDLMAKPIGIQGVALVSAEGQPIIPPIGIDKNGTLIMAGSMLYLAKSTQDEFHWQGIETIAVRAREGHIILSSCSSEVFLLVKAGKALSGLLEGEINRAIEKLQATLQLVREASSQVQAETIAPIAPEVLPKIDEVLYEFNAEVSISPDDEIRYRGRRTNI